MPKLKVYCTLTALVMVLLLIAPRFHAADSLPKQITDEAFWQIIESSSEPGGAFQSENFLSNETGFQAVIPALKRTQQPGGVYMGVGPEQNFTYIAAIKPKVAFIIDIRRQNMLEHMIYKALFEMSADRADFLSRLFCRKRPSDLTDKSTVDELFNAYVSAPPDGEAFSRNLKDIRDLLLEKHKLGLSREDQTNIEHVYAVFRDFGPNLDYNSGEGKRVRVGGRRGGGIPNYVDLMTATDLQGEKHGYLANEENYRFIRDLEERNLIVPLTGDFGGPKAIRRVGQYLKDHSATVTAFYLSNVEQYLFQGSGNQNGGWKRFYENVATLPLDASSTFIRSIGGGGRPGFGGAGPGGGGGIRPPNVLASMQETVEAVKSGGIQTYRDTLALSK